MTEREDAEPPSDATTAAGVGAAVLVIDDHEETRVLLGQLLEAAGLTVHLADGAPAARAVLESTPIDVLVVDVSLAGESGIQLVVALRHDDRYRHLPAIVTTGHHAVDEIADEHPGLFQGAFQKPTDPAALLACIRELGALHPRGAPPAP